jgi:hypothetical protein
MRQHLGFAGEERVEVLNARAVGGNSRPALSAVTGHVGDSRHAFPSCALDAVRCHGEDWQLFPAQAK